MPSNVNLSLLIARSLSLPRKIRSGMLDSLRENPRKALSYGVLVDDLSSEMLKAYSLGYRSRGAVLRRESRKAKLADYKRRAREVLRQYQVSSNTELKRIYANAKAAGKTDRQIVRAVIARWNSLGVTPPATNRVKSLYNAALRSAYSQGLYDGSIGDATAWGYRIITHVDDKVRPTHLQFNGIILPKDHEFFRIYGLPPWDFGCRCSFRVYSRRQKLVKPPPRPLPLEAGFNGLNFGLR